MSTPSESTLAALQSATIDDDYGKAAEERGLIRNIRTMLLIKVDGNEIKVWTVTFCKCTENATGNLQHRIENHLLANDKSIDLVSIRATSIVEEVNYHVNP